MYIIFGLLVVAGLFILRSNNDKSSIETSHQSASVHEALQDQDDVSDTASEDDSDTASETGEPLSGPRTVSFSNAASNATPGSSTANIQSTQNISQKGSGQSSPSLVVHDSTVGVFGLLYADILSSDHNILCSSEYIQLTDDSSSRDIEYTPETFKLENVLIENHNAYLFVKSDMVPKNVCAEFLLFSQSYSAIHNVYVVITES